MFSSRLPRGLLGQVGQCQAARALSGAPFWASVTQMSWVHGSLRVETGYPKRSAVYKVRRGGCLRARAPLYPRASPSPALAGRTGEISAGPCFRA